MDARGIEHGRENALMRGSTEHTDWYTQGIRYDRSVFARHTNDGLRTGTTSAGRKARQREGNGGMPPPDPVAVSSVPGCRFVVGILA